MGGGKGGKAAAPDYTPVAASNEAAANIAAQVSREQLAWAKEQYAQDKAQTQQYLDVMMNTMNREADAAAADRQRYQQVFQPIEDQLIQDANTAGSVQKQEEAAGRAAADVTGAFEAQRKGALQQLESYGIDPSMARAGALDRAVRTAEGAATAGAANQARIEQENIGRALRGEAVNIGKGYPGQIAQAYGTAIQSGGSGINANLQTTQTGAGTMGTGVQWSGQQGAFLNNWGQNLNGQGQVYAANQNAQANRQAGWGALAGSVLGLGTALALRGGAGNLVKAFSR